VTGGYLLLSGILKLQDTNIIVDKAKAAGFEMQQQTEENGWTAILFKKA
jgi:ribosomal protein L11 methylase PrmA